MNTSSNNRTTSIILYRRGQQHLRPFHLRTTTFLPCYLHGSWPKFPKDSRTFFQNKKKGMPMPPNRVPNHRNWERRRRTKQIMWILAISIRNKPSSKQKTTTKRKTTKRNDRNGIRGSPLPTTTTLKTYRQ